MQMLNCYTFVFFLQVKYKCSQHDIKIDLTHIKCFLLAHMKLMLLVVLFSSSLTTWSAEFEGQLVVVKNRINFVDQSDQKIYTLTGSTPLISSYLKKLKSKDFLSVDAVRSAGEPRSLLVRSINYVGLRDMIGTWLNLEDNRCYIFSSYTEFSISERVDNVCIVSGDEAYNYFINPTTKRWVMLVASAQESYVGDIQILNSNMMQIKLYDSDKGNILKQLSLRKIEN